ncbi:MAG: hypothetical protein D6753_01760 [Planctomycetota bacterium]|nr:MAG: hypothetical protein D6753_01760 [Planctomycetota bacterium]
MLSGAALRLWLGGAVLLCVWGSGPDAVRAAGCHQQFDSGVQLFDGRLPQYRPHWTEWATGPVYRIYVDGRILYVSLPSGRMPCRGPQCRGGDPSPTLGQPIVPTTQRVVVECTASTAVMPVRPPVLDWLVMADTRAGSASIEPPLRPPCCEVS